MLRNSSYICAYNREQNNRYMKRTKKDIIVATHVLDSMKYSDTPYLSEIESIYRFVERGVTGFMLCGETNIGKYPIESIKTLKNIIDMYCETLI